MEVPEQNIIYKVYFQGVSESDDEDISLTFFQFTNEEVLLDAFPSFLLQYNEIARKKKVYSFTNIKEILPLGKASKNDIIQFYVLLFTFNDSKNEIKKRGFLIGKNKSKGFIVLGEWPYNLKRNENSATLEYNKILIKIIEEPNFFKDVLLIN
ncbi:MAG: hypothetical protein ACTSWX_15915 [Promethearchaeota archaeon]